MSRAFTASCLLVAVVNEAPADSAEPTIGVSFGLLQLALGGANAEIDLRWGRWIVGYSHGWSLRVPTTGAMADQNLSQFVPYTTGLGVGIQHPLSASFLVDARAELKAHEFVFDVVDGASRRELTRYQSVTAGAGAYVRWLPFIDHRGAIRGLSATASVRYWPRVWSSLDDDELHYPNETTGRTEVHRAADIGIANTPLVVNVSVGYVFPL